MAEALHGRRVLLVGGAGGIGSAIADALLAQGMTELVVASSSPRPTMADRRIETVDITDMASVRSLADRLEGRPLHAVIDCAGINGRRALTSDDWEPVARKEMAVNYLGLLNLAEVFGPMLATQRGSCFMALLSFLSFVNLPGMATYCASKAAAHSALQAVRARWTPQGVRVCGVYPTAVDTRMSDGLPGPKQSPQDLAREVVAALSCTVETVFPGDAAAAYAAYLSDPVGLQRAMAQG